MSVNIIIKALAAGGATFAFGILFNIHKKNLMLAVINGSIGFLIYLLCLELGISNAISLFGASLFMSLYSEFYARIQKAPSSVFLIVALIPIVPGAGLFRTALALFDGNTDLAGEIGVATLLDAGAIALAIIIVSSIVQASSRRIALGRELKQRTDR